MSKIATIGSKSKNGTSRVVRKDAGTGKFASKTKASTVTDEKAAKRKALTLKAFRVAYEDHQKKA